jgi:hypothetical protein
MFEPDNFRRLHLIDDLRIAQVVVVDGSIDDLFGQPALGRTRVAGRQLHIEISSGLSEDEKSVTLYHEVLEALTVIARHVPELLMNFGEQDFEREGYRAFDRFGAATPATLESVLQFYGFKGE